MLSILNSFFFMLLFLFLYLLRDSLVYYKIGALKINQCYSLCLPFVCQWIVEVYYEKK